MTAEATAYLEAQIDHLEDALDAARREIEDLTDRLRASEDREGRLEDAIEGIRTALAQVR